MNNNKKVSTKTTSAIFLAIVLVTGTITALSAPSFMIGAQGQPYYNSYEPPQYQPSYKPDYKVKYPSDNNNYKSKDSKNVSINKLKCINNNLNINGNNTGDFNIGNKGQGYLGANSYGAGYYDGHNNNKQDKGFDCVINNNNNNTNVVGGGQPPIPPANVTCEECILENLTPTALQILNQCLATGVCGVTIGGQIIFVGSLAELCEAFQDATAAEIFRFFSGLFDGLINGIEIAVNIVVCLTEVFNFDTSPTI